MKLKDLIPKLQALNPEAEVYVWGYEEWEPITQLVPARKSSGAGLLLLETERNATPSDTLIVLSE